MRIGICLLGLLLISFPVISQESEASPEQIIGKLMQTGIYDGNSEKLLGKMGDEGAVTVIKLFGDRLLGPSDIENALAIVHLSFSALGTVSATADHQPRATLFLLRSLEVNEVDQRLRNRIVQERSFVLEQSNKYAGKETR